MRWMSLVRSDVMSVTFCWNNERAVFNASLTLSVNVVIVGGLGGGEPLLGRRAGSPKPLCLQPLSRGGEGARSWGKSHRVLMALSGQAGGVPLLIIFTLGLSIPT